MVENSYPYGGERRFNEIGSASVNPFSRDGVLRVLQTIRWGTTISDKVRIAAYYCLRIARAFLSPDHDLVGGMYPQYWIGDVDVSSATGRFVCRANTIDFDIVNPNYEASELEAFGGSLARFDRTKVVCLDVGAHIGKFSIFAGRVLGGRGEVLAFEPEHRNFSSLEQNIVLNQLNNVRAFNVACGSRDETRPLSLSTTNIGAHTLADRAGAEKVPVRVRALDSVLRELGIERVHVMKLDVEYMEAEVLRGAQHTLESSPEVEIFFEETDSSDDAASVVFLRSLGFSIRRLGRDTCVAARPRRP